MHHSLCNAFHFVGTKRLSTKVPSWVFVTMLLWGIHLPQRLVLQYRAPPVCAQNRHCVKVGGHFERYGQIVCWLCTAAQCEMPNEHLAVRGWGASKRQYDSVFGAASVNISFFLLAYLRTVISERGGHFGQGRPRSNVWILFLIHLQKCRSDRV